MKAILGAFHRIEGDALGNESSIWENVVLEGVSMNLFRTMIIALFRTNLFTFVIVNILTLFC